MKPHLTISVRGRLRTRTKTDPVSSLPFEGVMGLCIIEDLTSFFIEGREGHGWVMGSAGAIGQKG